MQAISLSVGKDGGKYVEGSAIVVLDDNGTPLVGIEKHGDTLVVIYSHTEPAEMQAFMAKHGLPSDRIDKSEFTLR